MFIHANIRKIFLFRKLFEFYLQSIQKTKGPLGDKPLRKPFTLQHEKTEYILINKSEYKCR